MTPTKQKPKKPAPLRLYSGEAAVVYGRRIEINLMHVGPAGARKLRAWLGKAIAWQESQRK